MHTKVQHTFYNTVAHHLCVWNIIFSVEATSTNNANSNRIVSCTGLRQIALAVFHTDKEQVHFLPRGETFQCSSATLSCPLLRFPAFWEARACLSSLDRCTSHCCAYFCIFIILALTKASQCKPKTTPAICDVD